MAESRDDQLMAELRRIANEVDAVPDEVTTYGKAALGWRRIDADLAELLTDSHLGPVSAATRAGDGGPRFLAFKADGLEIDLEISDGPPIVMLGQLAPPVAVTVDVQRDDDTVEATGESDELGRFRIELPRGGKLRLILRREPPAPQIETSWLDI